VKGIVGDSGESLELGVSSFRHGLKIGEASLARSSGGGRIARFLIAGFSRLKSWALPLAVSFVVGISG
jgi:hypothetical protein